MVYDQFPLSVGVAAINLVYAFKLKPYELDKKAYKKHIMEYGKKLIAKMKDAGKDDEYIEAYKKKLGAKVNDIVKSESSLMCCRLCRMLL